MNKQLLKESILRFLGGILFVVPVLLIFEFFLFDIFDPSNPGKEVDENFVYVFIPTFILMWISISAAISYIGGWHYLQKKYRTYEKISGVKVKGRSLSLGFGYLPPASYRNCVKIYITENGLYMKSMFLFRLFHPPLLIPWDAIMTVKFKKILLFKTLKIRIGKIRMGVYGKLAQEINER